jgi:hypothetical protein
MLSIMRRLSLATVVLAVLGIGYALVEGWLIYEATPVLSRELLLILSGYGATVAVLMAVIVLLLRVNGSSTP